MLFGINAAEAPVKLYSDRTNVNLNLAVSNFGGICWYDL